MGATAHVLHLCPPADPAELSQYVKYSQPLYLMLFAGCLLVLLGWFGEYAFQCRDAGVVGLLAFLFLFLGILFTDLLRCVPEFSVIPVLAATAPYATPGLAEATYHSTPLAAFERAGEFLLLVGAPLAAFSIRRGRELPFWSVVPFAVTTVPLIARFLTPISDRAAWPSASALYLSMTILGIAVFRANGRKL